MSDINIPGVATGKYDKLIETLMKKERAPRDNAAENLKVYKQQYTLWQAIGRFSTDVREKTRTLYSYNNPFVEKQVETSNERVITATASRNAYEQKVRIAIEQIAQSDAFLSKEMAKDYQVLTGSYTFSIGEKKITIDWQGGSYKKFISLVNRKAKDIVHISEIKTNDTSYSLLFEAQAEGSNHKLRFENAALSFALENGILKKNEGTGSASDDNIAELQEAIQELPTSTENTEQVQTEPVKESELDNQPPTEQSSTDEAVAAADAVGTDAAPDTADKEIEEYVPVNAVSQAQDAIVNFEGITVTRGKNDIDDLIPGVTLHLADKTDKKEVISVIPDTEAAKNAIIELVAMYNRLLAEINIATSKQPEVIEEIGYFNDEERKQAEENLGVLFGDRTLSTLKNNLRQVVSNVYRKNDDTAIRSLSQIGISTKTDTGSNIQAAQLRGYLEIDEKKLDAALKNHIEDVRYLFGYDTDNDKIADDGVAVQLFAQLDPYIQRGGLFSTRTNGLKTQMQTTESRIERYDKQLEKKEIELKKKYGIMDGSLKNLDRQSRIIDDFSKQNRKKE